MSQIAKSVPQSVRETQESLRSLKPLDISPPGREQVALSFSAPELAASASRYAQASKAPNTLRTYASQWRKFSTWCDSVGIEAMPSSPETVAAYITALADSGRKSGTISKSLAAIAFAHRTRQHPNPTADDRVRQVFEGIRRTLGTASAKVTPLLAPTIRDLVQPMGESMRDVRNRALLCFGMAGAFRRSELVALNVEDIEEAPRGIIVRVRRSKTDQVGEGAEVAIPYGRSPETCPVRTLIAWVEAAGIESGPLFRSVTKGDHVTDQAMSAKSVSRVIKRSCRRVGIDPKSFSAHSLRSGMATASASAGKPLDAIMRQGRWKTPAVAASYIRRANAFDDNAADGIGL